MYSVNAFNAALAADNNTYERFKKSDLHNLVALARGGTPFVVPALAALMNGISREKWRKYYNVKCYLLAEVPGLAHLVRAHLGTLVTFRTHMMRAIANGRIEHVFCWGSNTGNLNDLAHVRVRERVQWGNSLLATHQYLDGAYRFAGVHVGLGTSFANTGRGVDTHDLVGPFTAPPSMVDIGHAVHALVLNQTYEFSDDGGATWNVIPNSSYTITRQLSTYGTGPRFTITKVAVMDPTDICMNSLNLL